MDKTELFKIKVFTFTNKVDGFNYTTNNLTKFANNHNTTYDTLQNVIRGLTNNTEWKFISKSEVDIKL